MEVIIHFRFGSRPKQGTNEKKVFGGFLGGHVFLQLDTYYYGFEPANEGTFHFFPKHSVEQFNSVFKKQTSTDWHELEQYNKRLSIHIPLTQLQRDKLYMLLNRYHTEVPYDYAVFGMRCAACTYSILSQIGIVKKHSIFMNQLLHPWPHFLRIKLLDMAIVNNWQIELHEGKPSRVWEEELGF